MRPVEFIDGAHVHRPWFKLLFNPVLRKLLGVEIATVVDTDTWTPPRYTLQRYNKQQPAMVIGAAEDQSELAWLRSERERWIEQSSRYEGMLRELARMKDPEQIKERQEMLQMLFWPPG